MDEALIRQVEAQRREIAALRAECSALVSFPFLNHEALSFQPFSANQTPFLVATPYLQRVRLQSWSCVSKAAATNNGSNYWTITLASSAGTLASFTTAADTAATWTQHAVAQGDFATNPLPTTVKFLYVTVGKTGSPGALNLSMVLLGRLS